MKNLNIISCLTLVVLIATLVYSKITFSAELVKQASPRSYLELPTSGKLSATPYVWERKTNRKHLVVIGTRHERNPRSPMFDRIEAIFKRVRPEMVIHESVALERLNTMPRDQAIISDSAYIRCSERSLSVSCNRQGTERS